MDQTNFLNGKTILITGATSGIGYAAMQALAAKGACMIGVGRSQERCYQAQETIQKAHSHAQVSFLVADLSSQGQVRQLSENILEKVSSGGDGRLDVLINNAGTVSSWYTATEDGYELQFAVNHLAPFLLTHALLPILQRAPSPRVITVSSGSHYRTKIHWQDVMYRKGYNCLSAYKQSKLANVLFSSEFNRRFAHSNIRAYAADPGLVNTGIGLKGTGGLVRWVWQRRRSGGVSPEQGARTTIFLAADESVEGSTEVYWKDCKPVSPSRYAQKPAEAARLWALSERLCGLN